MLREMIVSRIYDDYYSYYYYFYHDYYTYDLFLLLLLGFRIGVGVQELEFRRVWCPKPITQTLNRMGGEP